MYSDLAKELKKNIEVMTGMFEANNLQVLKFSVRPRINEDDGNVTCKVLIELTAIEETGIPNSVDIKINLYDEDDELYLTSSAYVSNHSFNGYDTVSILCLDENVLMNAVKGRLYATKF